MYVLSERHGYYGSEWEVTTGGELYRVRVGAGDSLDRRRVCSEVKCYVPRTGRWREIGRFLHEGHGTRSRYFCADQAVYNAIAQQAGL